MSSKGNGFHFTRGKSATRRSMLLACGAVCNAAVLAIMAPNAQAQASYTWTSTSSGNWSNGTNWMGGSAPVISPTGDASLEFNAAGTYTSNNNLGPFYVYNTTFDSGNGPTTLTGGDLDLSWPLSENNNPAFTDNSTNPVTIDNNVTFEAPENVGGTSEYFVIAPGATTTFNGSMNLTGGSSLMMTNGEPTTSLGGPGGTMIWTQPEVFTNNPNGNYGGYFAFRIYEGTFEMGGYTIDNGSSDAPIQNVAGVNVIGSGGVNNSAITDMYLGPEDRYTSYNPISNVLLHPNDVVAFYLMSGGQSFNQPVQFGDAGSITIGGINTSGTVTFNDFFKSLPTDGNGIINGQSQTIYFSAAAGGTVLQNFAVIRGGPTGDDGASIDKIGPGTWIVAGGGDNPGGEQAYVGNTTVRDGILELEYDDTGINNVTLPAAALAAGAPYYANGADGGSLGYNAPTNAVQLGDSGTLPTDNIALLTLTNPGAPGPRQVLHNISVNADNPSGATTIGVGDNGTGNFSGNISLSENVVLTGGTGGLANFTGNISGSGALTVNGTGTVDLSGTNTFKPNTTISGGTLEIATTSSLPSGSTVVNNGTLNIQANTELVKLTGTGTLSVGNSSTLQLAVGSGLSTENGLQISAGSTLDITNNHMVINYAGGADPIGTIATLITDGAYGSGTTVTWSGTGITSSQAAANVKSYGIGYADSADPGNPANLASGTIEIMYTLLGDANLDGKVNGTDFNLMATNFNQAVTDGWDKGDFNYDGKVNGNDFVLLASNFNQFASQSAVSSDDAAALDAFAAANGISLTSVPEPASMAIMAAAGLGILRRRRRA